MTTPAEYQTAAQQRIFGGVPPFALVGSPPKVGKTSDSVYCLPNALFLYSDGGLKPAVSNVGWAPLDTDDKCPNLQAAIRAIEARIKAGDPKKGLQFKSEAGQAMWGVVIDDFTLKAKAEVARIEADPPKDNSGKKNVFAVWAAVNAQTYRVIQICRELGMPAYLSAHTRDPEKDKDTQSMILGGPDVASKALSKGVTAWVDLISYVVADPARPRWPWGLSVSTRGGLWLAGDRHNVVSSGALGQPMTTPLNTAEVFRAVGYKLPRAGTMDMWMENVLDFGVKRLMVEKQPESIVKQELVNAAKSQVPAFQGGKPLEQWQAVWMLRDLLDRVEIREKSQFFNPLASFGVTF